MNSERAALSLLRALVELQSISKESQRALESAQARARDIESSYESALRGKPESLTSNFNTSHTIQDMDQLQARSEQRERTFLCAFEALMALYSETQHQGVATEVFNLLRAIKLIDFECSRTPAFPMSPELKSDGPWDKRRRLEFMSSFHQQMRAYHEQVQQGLMERAHRQDELLGQAVEIARQL